MLDQDKSEPAFPCHPGMMQVSGYGMSIRDYFAAASIIGLFAATVKPGSAGLSPKVAAEEAYKYADALIIEREKLKP